MKSEVGEPQKNQEETKDGGLGLEFRALPPENRLVVLLMSERASEPVSQSSRASVK